MSLDSSPACCFSSDLWRNAPVAAEAETRLLRRVLFIFDHNGTVFVVIYPIFSLYHTKSSMSIPPPLFHDPFTAAGHIKIPNRLEAICPWSSSGSVQTDEKAWYGWPSQAKAALFRAQYRERGCLHSFARPVIRCFQSCLYSRLSVFAYTFCRFKKYSRAEL